MLKHLRPGVKVKYVGEFEGQIKTGTIITVKEIEITFGTRVNKWFSTVRAVEKDETGGEIVLFLENVAPT